MIPLQYPPKFADGGFLYVKEAFTDERGNIYPVQAGTNWTATYAEVGGKGYFVLRYPKPITGEQADKTVDEVLTAANKFTSDGLGRIRGR